MATHGKLDEFQCDNGDAEAWNEYCERLGHYFVANKVTDAAIKKSILLSVCGARTYKLMRNLVSPQKPGELSYDDLVKVVKNHHNPQPSEIVERFKFNSRNQRSNETISEYVAEHPGICTMKSLARSYIWWPSMDSDVEQMAHTCNELQQ